MSKKFLQRLGVLGVMVAVGVGAAGSQTVIAQESATERAAVERAALDYLEGFYEGDVAKLQRGVHPDVVKYGFFVPDGQATYSGEPMSFQQMLDYATQVKEQENFPGADAPKEVEIYEVLDQTAIAKVTAWWGSDYLHLAKYDGDWKIIHVLWQTAPR